MDTIPNITLRGYPVAVAPPSRYRGLMLMLVGPKPVTVEVRPDTRLNARGEVWEGAKDRFNVVAVYPSFERSHFGGCTRPEADSLVGQVPAEFSQEIRLWRDRDGTPRGHSDCGADDPLGIGRLTDEEATTLLAVWEDLIAKIPAVPTIESLREAAFVAKDSVPATSNPEDHRPYVVAALAYWNAMVNKAFDHDNAASSFHAVEQVRLFEASLARLDSSNEVVPA